MSRAFSRTGDLARKRAELELIARQNRDIHNNRLMRKRSAICRVCEEVFQVPNKKRKVVETCSWKCRIVFEGLNPGHQPRDTSLDKARREEARAEADVWRPILEEYLEGRDKVSSLSLWGVVGVDFDRRTQAHNFRLGRVMKLLGWRHVARRKDGKTWNMYVKC